LSIPFKNNMATYTTTSTGAIKRGRDLFEGKEEKEAPKAKVSKGSIVSSFAEKETRRCINRIELSQYSIDSYARNRDLAIKVNYQHFLLARLLY
jgi:hypothetical protein